MRGARKRERRGSSGTPNARAIDAAKRPAVRSGLNHPSRFKLSGEAEAVRVGGRDQKGDDRSGGETRREREESRTAARRGANPSSNGRRDETREREGEREPEDGEAERPEECGEELEVPRERGKERLSRILTEEENEKRIDLPREPEDSGQNEDDESGPEHWERIIIARCQRPRRPGTETASAFPAISAETAAAARSPAGSTSLPIEFVASPPFSGSSASALRRDYVRKDENGETVLKLKENGDCVFWDDGCTIYPERPRQCRTFPFWGETLELAFRLVEPESLLPRSRHREALSARGHPGGLQGTSHERLTFSLKSKSTGYRRFSRR